MTLVLDSSAMFSMEDLPSDDCYVTPGVMGELRRHGHARMGLLEPLLKVSEPTKASVNEVVRVAKETGDVDRLSPVDIGVLALALDVRGTILTDDFSIQNVAKRMGVESRPVGTKGIRKQYRWKLRCVGCGRFFNESIDECPICGSKLKTVRRR